MLPLPLFLPVQFDLLVCLHNSVTALRGVQIEDLASHRTLTFLTGFFGLLVGIFS